MKELFSSFYKLVLSVTEEYVIRVLEGLSTMFPVTLLRYT